MENVDQKIYQVAVALLRDLSSGSMYYVMAYDGYFDICDVEETELVGAFRARTTITEAEYEEMDYITPEHFERI